MKLGIVVGLYDVTGDSDYPRNVVNLEQIMDAPSDEDVRTLVESARDEALMERPRRNLVVNCEPSFFFPGLVNNWTCPRWVPQFGVVPLSHLLRFRSSVRLLCL